MRWNQLFLFSIMWSRRLLWNEITESFGLRRRSSGLELLNEIYILRLCWTISGHKWSTYRLLRRLRRGWLIVFVAIPVNYNLTECLDIPNIFNFSHHYFLIYRFIFNYSSGKKLCQSNDSQSLNLFFASRATTTQLTLDLIHYGFCEFSAIFGYHGRALWKYLCHYIPHTDPIHILQLNLL